MKYQLINGPVVTGYKDANKMIKEIKNLIEIHSHDNKTFVVTIGSPQSYKTDMSSDMAIVTIKQYLNLILPKSKFEKIDFSEINNHTMLRRHLYENKLPYNIIDMNENTDKRTDCIAVIDRFKDIFWYTFK